MLGKGLLRLRLLLLLTHETVPVMRAEAVDGIVLQGIEARVGVEGLLVKAKTKSDRWVPGGVRAGGRVRMVYIGVLVLVLVLVRARGRPTALRLLVHDEQAGVGRSPRQILGEVESAFEAPWRCRGAVLTSLCGGTAPVLSQGCDVE